MADHDILVLPIHRSGGNDQPALPGLYSATAPRRAARGRADNKLILVLSFTGSATFSADGQRKLLERLADSYFNTSGSVTAALRDVAEALNNFLLERNMRGEARNLQATGLLTQFVIHRGQIYIAQSGPSHVFTVRAEGSAHLHETTIAGHGLGLGKTTQVRFTHFPMDPGNLLIFSQTPPADWTTRALGSTYNRNLQAVHLGLMRDAPDDLSAVLIQVQDGNGQLRLLKPLPTPGEEPEEVLPEPFAMTVPEGVIEEGIVEAEETVPAESPDPAQLKLETDAELPFPETSEVGEETLPVPPFESSPEKITAAEEETPTPIVPPFIDSAPSTQEAAEPLPPTVSTAPLSEPAEEPPPLEEIPAPEEPKPPRERVVGPAILRVGRAIRDSASVAARSARAMITRIMPGNELFTIPSGMMAFIALVIPIIIITIAGVVYLRVGVAEEYELKMSEALALEGIANTQTEPGAILEHWGFVLTRVNQAEFYQVTDESQALRSRAYAAIDTIEHVERLAFQPAISGGLPDTIQIADIAVTDDALYMLNATDGSVVRALLTATGYRMDNTFQCKPGPYADGGLIVENLVDLVALPRDNDLGAAILAMDSNGILVYCIPGNSPNAISLPPPYLNWGNPIAFTLDRGNLYVLDPQTNTVWIYNGTNYRFAEPPRQFFDDVIPETMLETVDLAVDTGELFLLYNDGHLANCILRFGTQKTQCTNPAPYTDTREGFANGPTVGNVVFSRLHFTPPPGPSIYMLDPINQAAYQFSLQRVFNRQYRPANPAFNAVVTAFAVTADRRIFFAYEDDVQWAILP